jgi:hypothetical protein
MLSIANAESVRACTVIAALADQQITLGEFEEAIRPLSSEALQVAAVFLCGCVDEDHIPDPAMARASGICRRLAAKSRPLC